MVLVRLPVRADAGQLVKPFSVRVAPAELTFFEPIVTGIVPNLAFCGHQTGAFSIYAILN